MRIIIVQAEIEAAIKAYVLGQISIAPGQEVTVEFKNTRGEDGATADINISAPVAVKTPSAKLVTRTVTPAVTKVETPAKAEEEVAEPSPNDPAPSAEVAVAETAVIEATADAVPFDGPIKRTEESVKLDEPEAAAPAPAQSLFGSLTRPKND